MEVLVVGNTAYVDDDFCAKAFPGDHVQVVAAAEARRDESSPHASWKELLQHLDQAYEFDRVVYLSNYLTPHTDTVGDIETLRSVFRACAGRRIQLLYVAGCGCRGCRRCRGANGQGNYRPCVKRPVPLLCCSRGRPNQDPARAVPVYRVCRAGGPVFGAAVRRVLNRIGRSAGRAGCGVSPAVCRGACGAGTPYLR